MSPINAPLDMSLGLKMTTSLRTTTSSTGVTQISIIDQILLPHTTTWLPITSPEEAHAAIKRMQIRGAPAIASLAALAFAAQLEAGLAASQSDGESTSTEHKSPAWLESEDALKEWVIKTLDYLNTARPTAVNLGQAMRRLRRVLDDNLVAHKDVRGIVQDLVATAHAVADEDVGRNRAMAKHGAEWLLERVEKAEGSKRKLRVMTVCNTGSLATSGYGTAIGVITHLFETGFLERAYYTQSTPYHQGSRLTALELKTLGAPSCMICDSMVGSLLQHHKIDAILVGADRIAANGDTANKVGTYNAAVLAARHGVPLLVVAPITTVDLDVKDGSQIPIEHRPPLEACTARGALFPPQLDESGKSVQATVLITPALSAIASLVRSPSSQHASSGGVPPPPPTPGPTTSHDGPVGGEGEEDTELQQVYNPSFDVTPADLIAAIVTEKGVLVKEGDKEVYDLRGSSVV